MKIRFRPLPGFTMLMLPVFAALVALGVWQLERLQWKLRLIAQIEHNTRAPPVPIAQVLSRSANTMQYRHVVLIGRFLNAQETYVFMADSEGNAVYHVLTPMALDGGQTLIVDRGVIPTALREPATRRAGEFGGEQHVVGVVRTPDPPSMFTPAPDKVHRIWYARDLRGIAAAEHIRLSAPVIVEADAAPVPGGWPRGGQTDVNLPNNHLQYAITWFLLAMALAFVYVAYHRARGRFALGPD